MMGLMLFGQAIAMALIALGIGYIVYDLADKQKGFLRSAGYVIGTVIIIVGIVILANAVIASLTLGKRLGGLGMGMPQQRMMQQPHMMPSMPSQNQTQVK